MRRPSPKSDRKLKPSFFIKITIIFIIVAIIFMDMQLRPQLAKVATYQGKQISQQIISKSVSDVLNSNNISYDKLSAVTQNTDGSISSVQTNVVEVNKLQAELTYKINQEIGKLSENQIKLDTGTLSGLNFLYGRGPELTFKLKPIGYVKSDIYSKFSSAGVNQTLHQLIFKVSGKTSVIIPGNHCDIDIGMDIIVAETIIVGKIPDSYINISGSAKSELQKVINSSKLGS